MKVTEVLLNFRDALAALVPNVDRVRIPWKRPYAYDEWDDIANALFVSLVNQVLRWSFPPDDQERLEFAPYDLLVESYSGLTVVEVIHPELGEGRWVFHAFATSDTPFDTVEARLVSGDGVPQRESLETCAASDAIYVVRSGPSQEVLDQITLTEE